MGRYYDGDIQGKFWFGVQDSDDASFFGGTEYQTIEYGFEANTDMEDVKNGVQKCLEVLGENKKKLDDYFATHNGYNDTMLAEALGMTENELRPLLGWYARLELGEKIKKCLEEKGECYFTAEF